MKTRTYLVLVLAALLALVGCNKERTVTGTMGERQVAGKVMPVGDIAGASPEGIEVRARGLGVVSTTDATGAFLLTGLPQDAIELTFSRSIDGIDADLVIDANIRSVTVELQSRKASTRKRGARSPQIQLEGPITAISDTSITVTDASRKVDITAAIVETTSIRKGNRALTPADLVVGDRVHVVASPNEDNTYNAIEIKLQNHQDDGVDDGDDDAPLKRELEGPVVSIDAASITVLDASTGEQTAVITAETLIRKGGTTLTVEDIEPGDRVHVRARVEDDLSLTAIEIKLQEGNHDDPDDDETLELEGSVVSISDTSITVLTSTGEQTAAITAETQIHNDEGPLTVADIEVGDQVEVEARVEADASLTALEIEVEDVV